MFKGCFRFILGFLALFIGTVFFYFLMAVLLSYATTNNYEKACPERIPLYLESTGIHVDLILPKAHLNKEFKEKLGLKDSVEYVGFGWGDRAFYLNTPTWSDLKIGVALKALFLSSNSAMHVTPYNSKKPSWKMVNYCSEYQYRVVQYVFKNFQQDRSGNFIRIEGLNYHANDRFYEAKGSLSIFKTCNVWVNEALKIAGIQTAQWPPFAYGVMYHME